MGGAKKPENQFSAPHHQRDRIKKKEEKIGKIGEKIRREREVYRVVTRAELWGDVARSNRSDDRRL